MLDNYEDFTKFLPLIVSQEIFSYLSAKDLSNLSRISKTWREISNSNALWRRQCIIKGWLTFGTQSDILYDNNDDNENNLNAKNKISHPRFEIPQETGTLSKICHWKIVFLKVNHLKKNWKYGRYTPYPIFTAHSDKVLCIDCKDNILASGGLDEKIKLWNLTTKQCETIIHTGSAVYSLLFHKNQLIAGCDNGNILIICYESNKTLKILTEHSSSVVKLIYDEYLISVGLNELWNLENNKVVHVFSNHKDEITDIAKCNTVLVSSSYDGSLCIYDIRSLKLSHQLIGHKDIVSCICCNSDITVSGGSDGELFVWLNATGFLTHRLSGHFGDIHAVSLNDELIASASEDTTIRLWYLNKNSYTCKVLQGNHLGIVSLLYLNDEILISAGHGKRIVIWDWKETNCLHIVHRQPIQLHCMSVTDTRIITASPSSPGSLAIIDYWI